MPAKKMERGFKKETVAAALRKFKCTTDKIRKAHPELFDKAIASAMKVTKREETDIRSVGNFLIRKNMVGTAIAARKKTATKTSPRKAAKKAAPRKRAAKPASAETSVAA